jgi:hypothetical protein
MKRTKTGGRTKGTPNKATVTFKETVTALLQDNSDNIAIWLKQVAVDKDDPGRALDLLAKLAEYAYPKLARTELTGKDGKDLTVTVKQEDVDVL